MPEHIMLVNPWIYDFTAYDLWMKPLGLLYLASHLRKAGYTLTFLDCMDRYHPEMPTTRKSGPKTLQERGCNGYYRERIPKPFYFNSIPRYWSRFGLPREKVIKQIQEMEPPDWVLITCTMTYWYPGAVDFLHLIRKFWGKARVMIGGWYPTLCRNHALQWGFDRIIAEVEPLTVMRSLVSHLRYLHPVENYDHYFALRPAFDLYSKLDYIVVLTSIGCPFQCTYCASGRYFSQFWQRPWEQVFEEIMYSYHLYGIRHIVFYDDALLYRAEKGFIPLLKQLKKEHLPLQFHLPNSIHARYVTPEIATLMKENHFTTLRISLEFSDPIFQKSTGNKVNARMFEKAIQFLIQAGYLPEDIETYILFGFPGTRKSDLEASIHYVTNLGLKPRLALFSPIPGTPDFNRLDFPWIREDPLFQNKIAYLSLSGQYETYEEIQSIL